MRFKVKVAGKSRFFGVNFFSIIEVALIGVRVQDIYYIFKCGLHYLAMFKLFQRIIFACLSYIVYCNG